MKNEMVDFLQAAHEETGLIMFLAMRKALEADDLKASWQFYLNDLDKIVTDKKYRIVIETFFQPKGFVCRIPIR